jgi:hypothetical protein
MSDDITIFGAPMKGALFYGKTGGWEGQVRVKTDFMMISSPGKLACPKIGLVKNYQIGTYSKASLCYTSGYIS